MSKPGQSEVDAMNCADFQSQLPELFESEQDLSGHEHLKSCENCAALVRDLEYIAQQAKLLLPFADPSPAVWENIHTAIQREPASHAQRQPGRK
jgi:predicted anti-sigma-YlaC factor YlaD